LKDAADTVVVSPVRTAPNRTQHFMLDDIVSLQKKKYSISQVSSGIRQSTKVINLMGPLQYKSNVLVRRSKHSRVG